MARGWESKSVETQQEEAGQGKAGARRPAAQDEVERLRRRRTYELARVRAVADLDRATTAAHRAMLERTIADLDNLISTT